LFIGQFLSILLGCIIPLATVFYVQILVVAFACSAILYTRSFAQASFTALDTVCINTTINIQNTSVGLLLISGISVPVVCSVRLSLPIWAILGAAEHANIYGYCQGRE
jgi:hypothetical protein